MRKIISVTLLILLIDQWSKFYIKTQFHLGDSVPVLGLDWFRLTFVENPGMAYGIQFGGLLGKYFLVMMRVFLIGGMIFLFRKWLKENASNYLIIPMAMIFAGAIGNLIDGIFYGMIFDSGTIYDETILNPNTGKLGEWIGYDGVSKITTFGNGYSHFMKGCVVDMLHFPLINWEIPENIPIIGGKHIEFFKYIFNVADSAITVGGVLLFIFRKKAFPKGFDL